MTRLGKSLLIYFNRILVIELGKFVIEFGGSLFMLGRYYLESYYWVRNWELELGIIEGIGK